MLDWSICMYCLCVRLCERDVNAKWSSLSTYLLRGCNSSRNQFCFDDVSSPVPPPSSKNRPYRMVHLLSSNNTDHDWYWNCLIFPYCTCNVASVGIVYSPNLRHRHVGSTFFFAFYPLVVLSIYIYIYCITKTYTKQQWRLRKLRRRADSKDFLLVLLDIYSRKLDRNHSFILLTNNLYLTFVPELLGSIHVY